MVEVDIFTLLKVNIQFYSTGVEKVDSQINH